MDQRGTERNLAGQRPIEFTPMEMKGSRKNLWAVRRRSQMGEPIVQWDSQTLGPRPRESLAHRMISRGFSLVVKLVERTAAARRNVQLRQKAHQPTNTGGISALRLLVRLQRISSRLDPSLMGRGRVACR